jgi:transcriptional regulator with XRE-family HTH domain
MVEGDVYPEKLMGPNESAPRQLSIGPLKGQDAGAIVRAARLTAGLTLADLGRRCGYSASQVSRYERGITPLTDITLLRRFSQVLAIPPQVLGLTQPDGSRAGRHAVAPKDGGPRIGGPRVSREPQREDGEDEVPRKSTVLRLVVLRPVKPDVVSRRVWQLGCELLGQQRSFFRPSRGVLQGTGRVRARTV